MPVGDRGRRGSRRAWASLGPGWPAPVPPFLVVLFALLALLVPKATYLSTRPGRSYAVLGGFPQYGVLVGVKRGIIVEQPVRALVAVHEFGHILDYHGIRAYYDDAQALWTWLEAERAQVFATDAAYAAQVAEPPEGYIDAYAASTEAENFAQHLAAYVYRADEFRRRAELEPALRLEYAFLRDRLFLGREY